MGQPVDIQVQGQLREGAAVQIRREVSREDGVRPDIEVFFCRVGRVDDAAVELRPKRRTLNGRKAPVRSGVFRLARGIFAGAEQRDREPVVGGEAHG